VTKDGAGCTSTDRAEVYVNDGFSADNTLDHTTHASSTDSTHDDFVELY